MLYTKKSSISGGPVPAAMRMCADDPLEHDAYVLKLLAWFTIGSAGVLVGNGLIDVWRTSISGAR